MDACRSWGHGSFRPEADIVRAGDKGCLSRVGKSAVPDLSVPEQPEQKRGFCHWLDLGILVWEPERG